MDSVKALHLSHQKKLKKRLDKIKTEGCKLVEFNYEDEMKKLRKMERERQKRYHSLLGWFWRSHDWCYWTFWHIVRSHPIKETKWFVQRGSRGWSDCDAWGATDHLARVISEMTKYLSKGGFGAPTEFKTVKEWQSVLKEISVAFDLISKKEAYNEKFWTEHPKLARDCDTMTRDEFMKVEKGWFLFKKYFKCLWD